MNITTTATEFTLEQVIFSTRWFQKLRFTQICNTPVIWGYWTEFIGMQEHHLEECVCGRYDLIVLHGDDVTQEIMNFDVLVSSPDGINLKVVKHQSLTIAHIWI